MSLKQLLDANSIANEIRLERQVRKTAVLIVEGSDDKKLFTRFVEAHRCSIVGAYGKENVINVVSILDNSGFQGMLGVADRDFDDIENVTYASANLVFTDEHDAECMMLRSEALCRVLIENASESKLRAFEAGEGVAIRDVLLNRAHAIGCIRLISRRSGLSLNFDDLQFRFVDRDSLKVDVERLVDQIVSRTTPCTATRAELRQLIEEEMGEGHDLWQICCGHDMIAILAIGMRRCIGSAAVSDSDPSLIASKLRLAFAAEDFRSTSLFAAM